jgi:hypothetical protein
MLQRTLTLLFLILAFSAFSAAAGTASPTVVQSLSEIPDPIRAGLALGDLDGDHKTDIALGRSIGPAGSGYLYRLELRLSESGRLDAFTFSNVDAAGVNIAAVDVDGDHDLDLVISGRLLSQRIGVWINDGTGLFSENLYTLYAPDDSRLQPLRLETQSWAFEENASRDFLGCLSLSGIVPTSLFASRAVSISNGDRVLHRTNGQARLRAPPYDFSV